MLILLFQYVGIFFFILYLVFPLILLLFPVIFSRMIFLNYAYLPFITNLAKPDRYNFSYKNWRNLKIENKYGSCELGLWKILCKEDELSDKNQYINEEFIKVFSNGRPIVLYFHGNSMHRGSAHRLKLYHILRESGYHVLAVDYRGYADSSGSIHTEDDALEDAFVTFNYVKSIAPSSPLFIWGHSLGSGISSLLLNKLSNMEDCSKLNGLILESPFTSVIETMDLIRIAKPWRCMPYFNWIFKSSLINHKLSFNSIENLKNVSVPILILHAEDDKVLAFKMGQKLYSSLRTCGKIVFFKGFSSDLGYGHKHIIRYPKLPDLIRSFTNTIMDQELTDKQMAFDSILKAFN